MEEHVCDKEHRGCVVGHTSYRGVATIVTDIENRESFLAF
jgi:hypothetical protein